MGFLDKLFGGNTEPPPDVEDLLEEGERIVGRLGFTPFHLNGGAAPGYEEVVVTSLGIRGRKRRGWVLFRFSNISELASGPLLGHGAFTLEFRYTEAGRRNRFTVYNATDLDDLIREAIS